MIGRTKMSWKINFAFGRMGTRQDPSVSVALAGLARAVAVLREKVRADRLRSERRRRHCRRVVRMVEARNRE
jgi:hypothetical protein